MDQDSPLPQFLCVSKILAFYALGPAQLFFQPPDLFHPLRQQFFPPFLRWMVVFTAAKIIRHALHVGDYFVKIVRVLIALASRSRPASSI